MRNSRMKEARLMRMVDTYLKGREGSTMRSYQSSYKKLVEICRKCGISVFGLTEEARCEIWLEARGGRLSIGSVRKRENFKEGFGQGKQFGKDEEEEEDSHHGRRGVAGTGG